MDGVASALIAGGASIIVGLLTFAGVVITNRKSNDKMIQQMSEQLAVYRAVTDEKIAELTREVRKHNNFAERMPVVESEIEHMHQDVRRLQKFHERG